MDRNTIYTELNAKDYQYIIRQNGNRNLIHNGKEENFKRVSRNVKLEYCYNSERIYKNKKRNLHFSGGAVKVSLPNNKKVLWLVVLKEQNRGYSWYLMNNPACQTAQLAVESVLEGYGLRWKIEEVHRQIKTDYSLEAIRLQRYEALNNLNALLWMAASFLYTRLETLVMEIITEPELGLINRKKRADLFRFVYYKLALGLKRILAVAKVYYPPRSGTENELQLELAFPEYT
ncbi:MAG: transposase [Calditrichaceae bacterium]|nr:transposase [Calditrichaceae bacterium]